MSGKPARARPTLGEGAEQLPADDRGVAARLFAVLDAFTAQTPAASLSLSAIAERAGLPLSTTHRLVGEWVRWGGLARQEDGRYSLGMRLWEVGVQTPTARSLRTIALPYLEDLYETTREHVHLAILDGTDALYVEKLSGHHAVRVISRVGGRLPLHSTGVGLVLLAHAPNDVVQAYLGGSLPKFLPQTVTSPDELRKRLADIRVRGVAVMSEEMTAGSSSLAAPIRDRTGTVVAAVSIVTRTDPAQHPHPDPGQEQAVRLAAHGISRALGYRRSVARPGN
jgi:DNA-binding IclR family transcriptional regulator